VIESPSHITILGGGPAGLAAAHYGRRAGHDVTLYEASGSVGGNCRTIRFGEFLVDTGAHRLHDRDAGTTALARELLGDDLLEVDAPSQLYHRGRLIDFPLAPLDLLRKLPLGMLGAIAAENVALRMRSATRGESFGAIARATYGPTLADFALLGYSRKLWGRDPDQLLPEVAGTRLNRLDLRSFLVESFAARRTARRHLDGAFLYPRYGIGQLFCALGARLADAIRTSAPVTRLAHDGGRITRVETGEGIVDDPEHVVNTLPLGAIVRLLDPAPPAHVVAAARSIRFRQLRLAVVLLRRERFSANASIYVPDPGVPFTRLYESKNRSAEMAPAGTTSVVLEVPCDRDDRSWTMSSEEFGATMSAALCRTFGVDRREIIDVHELAVPNAYPILELAARPAVAAVHAYLASFENMALVGRNARFRYSSIHDMFIDARACVDALALAAPARI
jgi:protoporphyrinogen oxidase